MAVHPLHGPHVAGFEGSRRDRDEVDVAGAGGVVPGRERPMEPDVADPGVTGQLVDQRVDGRMFHDPILPHLQPTPVAALLSRDLTSHVYGEE